MQLLCKLVESPRYGLILFSCTWVLGFYVLSDCTHKNLSIVDSLSYKFIGTITLWVYLDNLLFTENWKLITENTVIKYFLKGKILFTCYCSHIFVHWLVHEQCHETRKKRKRSFNADALLNKHTLYICFFFFFFLGCFNDVQPNDCNCFNLDKFKNWTKPSIFCLFSWSF